MDPTAVSKMKSLLRENGDYDHEEEHRAWEDIVIQRLRELGDNEFAELAEKIRDEIGFWYA